MKRLSVLALVIVLSSGMSFAGFSVGSLPILEDVFFQVESTGLFRSASIPSELTWGLITTSFDQSQTAADLHAADNLYINNNLGAPERDELDEQTQIYSQLGNFGTVDVASAFATFHAAGGTFVVGMLYTTDDSSFVDDGDTIFADDTEAYQFNVGYGRMAGDNVFVGGVLRAGIDEEEDRDNSGAQFTTVEFESQVVEAEVGVKFNLGKGSFEDPSGLLAIHGTVTSGTSEFSGMTEDDFSGDLQTERLETEFLDLSLSGRYTAYFENDRLQVEGRIGGELRDGELDNNNLSVFSAGSGTGTGVGRGSTSYQCFGSDSFFSNGFDDRGGVFCSGDAPIITGDSLQAFNDDFQRESLWAGATVLFRPSEHMDFYAGFNASTSETELEVGVDVNDGDFFAAERLEYNVDTYTWTLAGRIYVTEALNIIIGAAFIQADIEIAGAADQAGDAGDLDLSSRVISSSEFNDTLFRLGLSYTINNAVQFHIGLYEDTAFADSIATGKEEVEADALVAGAAFSF